MFPEQFILLLVIAGIAGAISFISAVIGLRRQKEQDPSERGVIIIDNGKKDIINNVTEEQMNEIIRSIYLIKAKGVGASE